MHDLPDRLSQVVPLTTKIFLTDDEAVNAINLTQMKKPFLAITAIILEHSFSSAQTVIPAGSVSGTWTLAGSPYLIQGAVMIPNNSTLTIEPGVTVNFQGSYKLYVQGRLLAIGAVADSITFTAADTAVGWLGIQFDNTPATTDSSKFY